MTYQKTKHIIDKEDYVFGTPTHINKPVFKSSDRTSRNREGYHLVRVNQNTWIEVKDGKDDEVARQEFINKIELKNRTFYSNMDIQMNKHLEKD